MLSRAQSSAQTIVEKDTLRIGQLAASASVGVETLRPRFSHQVAEAYSTLVVLAGTIAPLHLAAAAEAFRVVTTRSALAPAVVS